MSGLLKAWEKACDVSRHVNSSSLELLILISRYCTTRRLLWHTTFRGSTVPPNARDAQSLGCSGLIAILDTECTPITTSILLLSVLSSVLVDPHLTVGVVSTLSLTAGTFNRYMHFAP